MAFRLQSAIAGAAKKASENLNELDEEYRESIKNTAANLAKEAAAVRKQRMAAVTDYNRRARKLKTNYDLSDGQIQTLLSGGLEEYDNFESAISSGEASAKLADPDAQFDAKSFAQGLFTTPTGGPTGDILSIAQQAEAYASQTAPSTLDVQTLASGIAAGTETPLTGISTAAVTRRLQDAAGTTMPADYSGPALGDTGISMRRLAAMKPEDLIALQQAAATLEQTDVKTKDIEAQTMVRGAQGNLIKAQTKAENIINQRLPEKIQAELDSSYASTALKEAQTAGVEQDTSKAILEQAKLKEELINYQKYGSANEQAALDLLEAKIAQANRPADLEQLQATFVSRAEELRANAASLEDDDPQVNVLLSTATMYDNRAVGVGNMIAAQDTAASSVDWSKGSPEKRFAALLKTNVQAANISGSLNSAGDWIADFNNKRPAYYTALANTADQYSALYGDKGNTGRVSSQQNYQQLGNVLSQWSQEVNFVDENTSRPTSASTDEIVNIDFGNKTKTELIALQNSGDLKPGDIAMIEDANGTPFVAMFGTQGEWISAGDF
jgi:hypothetical protein